ncbi:virulence RhuM family protein [Paraneptunicella aestuarii]|uniref:virulence RhuM family protein n=1 Tax=Paraneptunicella aestuarii TaxID=2831148 RepID=UPI001E610B14|nr:virulence RhuM family protein [Paraneptunicella aestuarii]UAA38579.1 virulence RhuM family protein [Paraneptunicella aestuarii]
MKESQLAQAPEGEFILFRSADGKVQVECRFGSDTLWLSQAMICQLYGKAKSTISEHISNIFEANELVEDSVVRFYRTTAADGKPYDVKYYSLPLILAVGYRVRSPQGTQFRQWATRTLQEYIVKGFVIDDERLKNPPVGHSVVPDYFDELLERIRDIRASERRVYLRVKDIFTMAADYEPSLQDTNRFFQTIQNKLHFASTGLTAAEIISTRIDANKPNLGLTSFKSDEVRKTDVTIAKNYLTEDEIKALNRIVNMWLDFAEDQAMQRKQIFLQDWAEKLDQFLAFNSRDVLEGKGSISKKAADEKARLEFEKYASHRRKLKEQEGAEINIQALRDILKQDNS